ncbi:hypothetical protein, partial [Alkalibacterium sp. s-m-28]
RVTGMIDCLFFSKLKNLLCTYDILSLTGGREDSKVPSYSSLTFKLNKKEVSAFCLLASSLFA